MQYKPLINVDDIGAYPRKPARNWLVIIILTVIIGVVLCVW